MIKLPINEKLLNSKIPINTITKMLTQQNTKKLTMIKQLEEHKINLI